MTFSKTLVVLAQPHLASILAGDEGDVDQGEHEGVGHPMSARSRLKWFAGAPSALREN